MNRRDASACVRPIVALDRDWEQPICEFRDCEAKAFWIVGYREQPAERFIKSRFACVHHMRQFCKRVQLRIPRTTVAETVG